MTAYSPKRIFDFVYVIGVFLNLHMIEVGVSVSFV